VSSSSFADAGGPVAPVATLLTRAFEVLGSGCPRAHAEMARRLGISQPTLNRLETARQNTTLRTLTQLCRALQCKVGDLFEGRVKLKASGRAQQ